MKMQRLGLKAMRVVKRAVATTLGLTAATSAFGADFRPFPTALSLPRDVAANTVVARAYLTPQALCGEGTCRLVNFRPISYVHVASGDVPGLVSNGPTVIPEIKGLRMQVLVNGEPQTKLDENQPSIKFSSPIEIQLLRDASPELGNGTTADPIQFWFFTKTTSESSRIDNYIRLSTRLTKIEGTCSVPSQTLELQPTRARTLAGIGTTAAERSFQISINNCPKGYNRIFYRLKPMGDNVEMSAGVLPLSAQSTAKGVRIRVTDSAGAAVVFDTPTRIAYYNSETGGSFSIPMRVSYVQTEANVTPGTVNGAMSVLMEYQ